MSVRGPVLVLLLAVALLLPGTPIGGASTLPSARAVALGSVSSGPDRFPAIFATPWAERAGFQALAAVAATNVTPAVGTVLVHLTLAPTSAALFRTPALNAAPLSLSSIADRYGRSPSDYFALEQYFERAGLSVVHTDPARLSLTVEGPAAAVGLAFGTTLESGTLNGRSVEMPATVPRLPAGFGSEVTAISGLSEGFGRFSLPLEGVAPVPPVARTAALPSRSTNQITPTAAHLAYGLDDLYNFSGSSHFATGQAIALLLWGDGFDLNDLRTFFGSEYPSEFPSVRIQWNPVDGAPAPNQTALNDPSQAPRELTLDLEWAGSMAPGATLDAVYAPDGPADHGYSPSDATMEDALTTAEGLSSVRAISMSFGTPDGSDPSFQSAFETGFAVATQHGITLLGASGDNGGTPLSGTCPSGGPAPQYPAASPQVLAVGGTAPTLSESVLGQVNGLASETAWNGSGGGFSATYTAPSWQSSGSAGSVVTAGGPRGIPDVAGPAQYDRFYYGGQPMAGNGTSFATPFWAGIITEMDALLGQPLGAIAQRFYYVAAQQENGTKAPGLIDVQGESGPACRDSTAGYDIVTGWGTPRGGPLFEDLIGTFVDVSLSVTPSPAAPGGSVSAAITVRNASSHALIPALAVVVSLTASRGYFGPCGGTMATFNGPTNASGSVTAGLGIPGCYFGTSVMVVVTILSGGYFGNVSASVPVNLLGLAGFLSFIQDFPYNVIAFGLIMAGAIALGLLIGRFRRRRARARSPDPPPPPDPATDSPPPAPSDPGPPGPSGAPGATPILSPPPAAPPPTGTLPANPEPPAGSDAPDPGSGTDTSPDAPNPRGSKAAASFSPPSRSRRS